jgi:hypothetical protein
VASQDRDIKLANPPGCGAMASNRLQRERVVGPEPSGAACVGRSPAEASTRQQVTCVRTQNRRPVAAPSAAVIVRWAAGNVLENT